MENPLLKHKLIALGLIIGLLLVSLVRLVSSHVAASSGQVNAQQAINWAEGQINHTTEPDGKTPWNGNCLQFVADAWTAAGVTLSSSANALTYWNTNPNGFPKTPASNYNATPPAGALVFWGDNPYTPSQDKGAGHVAISLGNGQVVSTPAYPYGSNPNAVFTFSLLQRPASTYNYLGWIMPSGVTTPVQGSNPAAYARKIVQWNNGGSTPNTSWLVSPDLKRYWIPDSSTYNCLLGNGYANTGPLSSDILNQLPDQSGQWATCGGNTLSTNRFMFRNTYIRSNSGRYILWLQQSDGNLVMYGPNGALWANSRASDFLVMQGDNNLVTYAYGRGATWASGTSGTRANGLVIQDDGNLVLYAPGGVPIWDRYHGRLR